MLSQSFDRHLLVVQESYYLCGCEEFTSICRYTILSQYSSAWYEEFQKSGVENHGFVNSPLSRVYHAQSNICVSYFHQGFGTLSVLLTIAAAQSAKITLAT